VSCAAYHPGNSLLVAGLTSGLFDIYQLPGWENIQVSHVRGARHALLAGSWQMACVSPLLAAMLQRTIEDDPCTLTVMLADAVKNIAALW